MITELGYDANGKTAADRFPFLSSTPYTLQLENGHTLTIFYDFVSDWMTYSLYDSELNLLISRQVLRSYPTNLSQDESRVLYYANGYLIDEAVEDFDLADLGIEPSEEDWESAIEEMQRYAGS